jgi:hypothetical protein
VIWNIIGTNRFSGIKRNVREQIGSVLLYRLYQANRKKNIYENKQKNKVKKFHSLLRQALKNQKQIQSLCELANQKSKYFEKTKNSAVRNYNSRNQNRTVRTGLKSSQFLYNNFRDWTQQGMGV